MGITVQHRKLLWARSGNLCAFPGCTQTLTFDPQARGPSIVVGEEAHIQARSDGGPRGNATLGSEERDHHQNLVLLCPTHHRVVDELPSIFDESALRSMKSDHESRVQAVMRSSNAFRAEEIDLADLPNGLTVAAIIRVGASMVALTHWDEPPLCSSTGSWSGYGLVLRHRYAGRETEELFSSSITDTPADVAVEGDTLVVTPSFFNHCASEFRPLADLRYTLDRFPAHRQVVLHAPADAVGPSRVAEVVDELRTIEEWTDKRIDPLLDLLFSAALADPPQVRPHLEGLIGTGLFQGGETIAIRGMLRALSWIDSTRTVP